MITKNAKISMIKRIGLFLAHDTCPVWVSWKVFAVTKEAWLMEAPCLEGTPSGWNTAFSVATAGKERDWRVTNGLSSVQAGSDTRHFCSH